MIETEPDGKTPTADGLVEHAAQSQAVDIACLHAKANDPPAELVHDDQYPVSFQENRLRPKQVQAPETILRVAQEREPRRAIVVRFWTVVGGQDSSYQILVDFGAEGFGELLRNSRATEARVTLLESDNGLDQFPSRPFGSWRASFARTE
jgi:hypothetical protein